MKTNRYFILIITTILFLSSCKEERLEVGQTWIYLSNSKNPFEKTIIYKQKIIAISNGYVQYIENEKDTLSISKRLFVHGAELQD